MTVVEVIAGGLNSLAVKHEMSGLPKSALKHNNFDDQYFVDFWSQPSFISATNALLALNHFRESKSVGDQLL